MYNLLLLLLLLLLHLLRNAMQYNAFFFLYILYCIVHALAIPIPNPHSSHDAMQTGWSNKLRNLSML